MAMSETSGVHLKSLARTTEILRLRRQGNSMRAIAEVVGCSVQWARQVVREALANMRAEAEETAAEIRQIELERLDDVVLAAMKIMDDVDHVGYDTCLRAAHTLLKAMERRAKLLGLDAPAQVASTVTLTSMSDTELIEQARRYGLEIPKALGVDRG